ncbi:hypothetical protein, partial [Nocardia tengchongensis]|uniref:hypothetical protein n=1 Tax=Nocardia tengchongensis TaxID=2055889 RepID=UPI003675F19E
MRESDWSTTTMRIFRDHDRDDDDRDDEQPRKNLSRDEFAAQAEEMVDAISDFLSDAAGAADRLSQAAPAARPATSQTTTAGQVTAPAAAEAVPPAPTSVAKPHTRGQIWRASAASSFVVVGLAATAAWGQPAEVGVPVVLYGLGWIAYLNWNAAR